MNRHERRRIYKAIETLIKRDGDHCSLCHRAFTHNSRTYGGVTAAGDVVLVGDCCAARLATLLTAGLCMARKYEVFDRIGTGKAYSIEDISSSINAYQEYVAMSDKEMEGVEKKGGLKPGSAIVGKLTDSPWKTDDAQWFAKNPKRSHRVRPIFPGEPFPGSHQDHELQVLVRQVEPGKRIKLVTVNGAFTPDNEAIIHALFDFESGHVASAKVLADLINKYADAERGQ
jgi:hypothetical protein